MVLLKDVGFRIGQNSDVKTIVLQVHYAKKFEGRILIKTFTFTLNKKLDASCIFFSDEFSKLYYNIMLSNIM